jgi:hypothetical protein
MVVSNVPLGGQNWLITPAALAVNQTPPSDIRDQQWLLVLSGIGICNFQGQTTTDWSRETIGISPDVTSSMNWAITQFSIPTPPQTPPWDLAFQVEEWAPFATINSIFDQNESINAGFAVDDWRPAPFAEAYDIVANAIIGNVFDGIFVDLAVRDSDAWLYRVGYHITLLGKIKFVGPPE